MFICCSFCYCLLIRLLYFVETCCDKDGKKKNMAGMLDVINKILNKKVKDAGQVRTPFIFILSEGHRSKGTKVKLIVM